MLIIKIEYNLHQRFLLNIFRLIKPVRKMTVVPKTMVRLLWKGLLNSRRFSLLKYNGLRLIHTITSTPAITPTIASTLRTFRDRNASRNNPSIPPLKIEASDHQASNTLSTPTSVMAISIPKKPITIEDPYKT